MDNIYTLTLIYKDDYKALEDYTEALIENGEAITDVDKRRKLATESTKDASERAKSYANEIANSTKVLEDFKLENEVKVPKKTKIGKFTDGLKDMASSALTGILNGVVNASVGMIASSVVDAGLSALNNYIHKNEIAIEEGESAKMSV